MKVQVEFSAPCLKCEVEGHNSRLRLRGDMAECQRCGLMNRAELARWESEYVARLMAGEYPVSW